MGERKPAKKQPRAPTVPSPSASVVVISPQNEILLLHRVRNGTFASAHVFPGGNLSEFHEQSYVHGAVDRADRHVDGLAYRLAAIRETFEESGILLARPSRNSSPAGSASPTGVPGEYGATQLLQLSDEDIRSGRQQVAGNKVRFQEWLSSVGGEADVVNLIPFTRWITPPNLPRRFTTQMYLYMLPVQPSRSDSGTAGSHLVGRGSQPVADLAEVTAAEFASAAAWLDRARRSDIILFPPQVYILTLLAPLLQGSASPSASSAIVSADRRKVLDLALRDSDPKTGASSVSWADMVISPRPIGRLQDGRVVLALDRAGPELVGSDRRGDDKRVVLVKNLVPGPPRDVEVRLRNEVDVLPLKAGSSKSASKM